MSEQIEPSMVIGEAFVGSGCNAAHINILLGPKAGPVGLAFANSLAAPRLGYIPFVAVVAPNVPCEPATLFVAKADLRGKIHETMTWGPAQAGVALGVAEARQAGLLDDHAAKNWVAIAAVWVDWSADDADAVFANNRKATFEAIRRGLAGEPGPDELAAALRAPGNPFYQVSMAALGPT